MHANFSQEKQELHIRSIFYIADFPKYVLICQKCSPHTHFIQNFKSQQGSSNHRSNRKWIAPSEAFLLDPLGKAAAWNRSSIPRNVQLTLAIKTVPCFLRSWVSTANRKVQPACQALFYLSGHVRESVGRERRMQGFVFVSSRNLV